MPVTPPEFPTLEAFVGNTPLVRLQRLTEGLQSTVLVKLEGNNPAGSVKDRPALNLIRQAEARGDIAPGDTLIEATSGNTGIAMAMAAAIKGYRMVLIMPDGASEERKAAMLSYGAELVLVDRTAGMEGARDLALQMQAQGRGRVLDQFANADNPQAHFTTTGPELWRDTHGLITHFVSSMGTTGTVMGTGQYLKTRNPQIQIIGVHPRDGAKIAGIRCWPAGYEPAIYDARQLDRILTVDQPTAERTARDLARREGIFAGISSGGALACALAVARQADADGAPALIVSIVCDRGDRYLSTGVFNASD